MKEIWGKIGSMKGGPWLLVLLFCLMGYLLLPGAGETHGAMTEEEARISALLSRMEGAGETQVSIFYETADSGFGQEKQSPAGAVILARGAGNVQVRLRLLQAAEALLGLPAERVEVFPMEETP